ncbi:50S ribosomal protein L35 [Candidatus Neptunichlamydia sp. REUL1]|uniref:50S ribosomal protein L35 n=1 Tax=Candidatus Neptunichlamydia sp. REUL1 TaxID=3064277 RepID=UPI00292CB80F|nr:50S ribosomal protein L35 [Candidatus Neptunochlamydia sp. REUL1]
MPKMKTKKAIRNRFKKTGTGKLMRTKQGRRHILTKKTSKRKRQLKKQTVLSEAFSSKYKRLACM